MKTQTSVLLAKALILTAVVTSTPGCSKKKDKGDGDDGANSSASGSVVSVGATAGNNNSVGTLKLLALRIFLYDSIVLYDLKSMGSIATTQNILAFAT